MLIDADSSPHNRSSSRERREEGDVYRGGWISAVIFFFKHTLQSVLHHPAEPSFTNLPNLPKPSTPLYPPPTAINMCNPTIHPAAGEPFLTNPTSCRHDQAKPICNQAGIPCCLHFVPSSDAATQTESVTMTTESVAKTTDCPLFHAVSTSCQEDLNHLPNNQISSLTETISGNRVCSLDNRICYQDNRVCGLDNADAIPNDMIALYYQHYGVRVMSVSQLISEMNLVQRPSAPKRTKAAVFKRSWRSSLKQKLRRS